MSCAAPKSLVIVTRWRLSRMLSASLSATFEKRTPVCSFRLGESESQRTTAFSSGMRLRSSSPKKSASIGRCAHDRFARPRGRCEAYRGQLAVLLVASAHRLQLVRQGRDRTGLEILKFDSHVYLTASSAGNLERLQVVLVQADDVEPRQLCLDGGVSSRVVRDHIGAPYAGILLGRRL